MRLKTKLRRAAALSFAIILASCAGQPANEPGFTPAVESQPSPPPAAAPTGETSGPEENALATQAATQIFTPTVVHTQTLGQTPAASLPAEGSIRAVEVASGLRKPVGFAAPRDNSGRIYILEQQGVIRVLENGQLLPEPFMDIAGRVGSSGSEQGLLGMDVEPGYATNGRFYLNYTNRSGNTVIARYLAVDGGAVGNPDSEQVLLTVPQPYANHNGGGVVFGPDGYLYLSLGDGGSGGDPQNNGQNPNTLLGSILRIAVVNQERYAVPADNPFAGGGGAAEVVYWGLRNPWRFSFDRLTGDLYIADVGQNAWEEISFYPAGEAPGANFGWNYYEGSHPYKGEPPADANLEMPVWEYDHNLGCSITGGYVYRGDAIPALRGVYVYTDYCTGNVYGLLQAGGEWQSRRILELEGRFSAFGEDNQGEIYLLEHSQGVLYRLDAAN